MGLLSIIRKQKLKDREVRILMLGLDNSGKTTIVKSLLQQDIKEVSPTMGFNIETLEHDGYTLNIWDVGGQSTLRPFWFNYFDRTDSLIWVVDVLSMERLQENFEEFDKILKEDRLIGSNLLILLNKIDLLSEDTHIDDIVEQVTKVLNLHNITNHEWKVLPVSAYTGENIELGITWILNEIHDRLY